MTVTTLGRVNVATPGTLVQLSTDLTLRASKLLFQVIPGLTGKAYVGKAGMTRSTLSGVIRVLWPNAAGGVSDSFFLEASDGADSINLASYWIDMDVAAEGLLITYWTE
jgi:hypothetical protein